VLPPFYHSAFNNIIVDYPEKEEKQQELQRRLTVAHGEAIIPYIKRLPCPVEQEKKILNWMIQKR
jgi:hypothetical protein